MSFFRSFSISSIVILTGYYNYSYKPFHENLEKTIKIINPEYNSNIKTTNTNNNNNNNSMIDFACERWNKNLLNIHSYVLSRQDADFNTFTNGIVLYIYILLYLKILICKLRYCNSCY